MNIRAPLCNIITSQAMELVCMDFLSVETCKGGYEYILVITDHYTRYAQAYPARNQCPYLLKFVDVDLVVNVDVS